MEEIFISYSRTDSQFVDALIGEFDRRGLKVWIDRESIEGGAAWRAAISEAIRECRAFLLVLSPNSANSKNVSRELSVAESRDRLIIPIIYQPCDIPAGMELQLAELQRIDFTQFSYEEALKRLLRVLVRTTEGIARQEQQPAVPVKAKPDRILTDSETTRTTNAVDSNEPQKPGERGKARRKISPRREPLDNRLPGHWRTTEALSSGGFSMASDTHCLLEASGRFQWWSISVSSTGETRSGPEYGNWSSWGNTLRLEFDDGRNLAFEYVLEGTSLLFPREKRYRLWERIN